MSTEPDTRPFTNAELAHFLEQLELDRGPPRSSRVEARPRRAVAREPATMLGMGKLVAFTAPGSGPVSHAEQLESVERPVRAPSGQQVLWSSPPRTFPDPFSLVGPATGPGTARWRVGLVLGALLFFGVIACLVVGPLRARKAHPGRSAPPPLPTPSAQLPDATGLPVDVSGASFDVVRASVGSAEVVPEGRLAARREAVDLLLAGRTRAALAAYRALPRALLAEPALVELVRQLERELRVCSQQEGAPCGG